MLIEIDGIDGAGKTTQCVLLHDFICQSPQRCLTVREPGGTAVGDKIKQLIMDEEQEMVGGSQTFLFLATKFELYQTVILPALREGQWVICDRGSLSFLSYHLLVSGFEESLLRRMLSDVTAHEHPIFRILLDVPPGVAGKRLKQKPVQTKFDLKGESFFEQQRSMFRFLANQDPVTTRVIDGTKSIDRIHKQIISLVKPLLKAAGTAPQVSAKI